MKQTCTLVLLLSLWVLQSFAQTCPLGSINSTNAFFLSGSPTQCSDPLTNLSNITINLRFILVHDIDFGGPTEQDVQPGLQVAQNHFASSNITFNDCYDIIYRDINIQTFYDMFEFGPEDVPGFINVYVFSGFPEAWPGLGCFDAPRIAIYDFAMERWFSHELGHVFQLYHTHENIGGNFEERVTRGEVSNCSCNCFQTGDLVCDTPPDNQNYGNSGNCTWVNSDGDTDNCGVVYTDPDDVLVENIMSYHACQTKKFEPGQIHRMRFAINLLPHLNQLLGNGTQCPSDYWMADDNSDNGDEPNDVDHFWKSPAIYSTDGWTGGNGVLNIMHNSGQSVDISVDVKNRGGLINETGVIKLYWAQASAGLGWESPFDGEILPACSEPLGGHIATQTLVNIAPGGTHTYTFSWNPPDPDNYINCFGDGWEHRHFCILARIETTDDAPFGMTYFETDDLGDNVRNNNNIVLRNITVYGDGIPGGLVGEDPNDQTYVLEDCFLFGNYTRRAMEDTELMIEFPTRADQELLNYTDISLNQGRQTFNLVRNEQRISSRRMAPGQVESFCISVRRNRLQPPAGRVFEMNIIQTDRGKIVGGENFIISLDRRRTFGRSSDPESSPLSEALSPSISPNPFNDLINIDLPSDDIQTLIYSSTGQLLYDQVLSHGQHSIDLKEVENGIYFVKMLDQNGTTLKMEKLVKIK
ncbi:MAG: zinc-dependent metalloprotease [Bacteroidota bacterium]